MLFLIFITNFVLYCKATIQFSQLIIIILIYSSNLILSLPSNTFSRISIIIDILTINPFQKIK